MAREVDLNALRQETLASMLATTAKDRTTALGLHACAEAELLFARAFGRLVGALHVGKFLKDWGRREWSFSIPMSMDVFLILHFL